MAADLNALFEQELTRRGVSYERLDEPDLYRIQLGEVTITANLGNRRRDALRDGDADAVRRFVDEIVQCAAEDAFSIPDWETARSRLYFAAEPAGSDFGDVLRTPITPQVARVVTLMDESESRICWGTPDMLQAWGVGEENVLRCAAQNQDRLVAGLALTIERVGWHKLGMVPLDSPYKASVIFAPSFRNLVGRKLRWPVLVVIPCRDFIYVLEENEKLLNRLGPVVVEEYRNSGYPITTEVLRISDDGITAIGCFPV